MIQRNGVGSCWHLPDGQALKAAQAMRLRTSVLPLSDRPVGDEHPRMATTTGKNRWRADDEVAPGGAHRVARRHVSAGAVVVPGA